MTEVNYLPSIFGPEESWLERWLHRVDCFLHRRHRLPLGIVSRFYMPGDMLACDHCGRVLVLTPIHRAQFAKGEKRHEHTR